MRLTPRYGAEPVIRMDGPPSAILEPLARQRRRLASTLAELSAQEWTMHSRCAGWTVRDVIVHLDSTNAFWSLSIGAGLAGAPTEFLVTFDPVSSPVELVAADPVEPHELVERFATSTERFLSLLEGLDTAAWTSIAEAPPGHVGIDAVAHHALWDSWVHERDVLLPLERGFDRCDDEIAACLRYVAALGPGMALTRGAAERGVMAVTATDPDVAFSVRIGDAVEVVAGEGTPGGTPPDLLLAGDAVNLLEALSQRRAMPADVPADAMWMIEGLAATFEGPPS